MDKTKAVTTHAVNDGSIPLSGAGDIIAEDQFANEKSQTDLEKNSYDEEENVPIVDHLFTDIWYKTALTSASASPTLTTFTTNTQIADTHTTIHPETKTILTTGTDSHSHILYENDFSHQNDDHTHDILPEDLSTYQITSHPLAPTRTDCPAQQEHPRPPIKHLKHNRA